MWGGSVFHQALQPHAVRAEIKRVLVQIEKAEISPLNFLANTYVSEVYG